MPRGEPTTIVAARFTAAELADMDARRGPLTRSEWIRFLHMDSRRRRIVFDEQVAVAPWNRDRTHRVGAATCVACGYRCSL